MYRKIDEPFQPSIEQCDYRIEPFFNTGYYLTRKDVDGYGEYCLCLTNEIKCGHDIPNFFAWNEKNIQYTDADGHRLNLKDLFNDVDVV